MAVAVYWVLYIKNLNEPHLNYRVIDTQLNPIQKVCHQQEAAIDNERTLNPNFKKIKI